MKDIILALIRDAGAPFAFIMMVLCAGPAIGGIVWALRRAADQSHQERMAEMELTHREKMLQLHRENPKVIEQHQQNVGHQRHND